MKKKLLPFALCAMLTAPGVQAQIVKSVGGKLDPLALRLVGRTDRSGRADAVADSCVGFVVISERPAETAEAVREAGYTAYVISDNMLSVQIPARMAVSLQQRDEVTRINGARRMKPLLNTARVQTGVDRLHIGEGMETPFTGKGVVVGIIDAGFQYNHPAFTDDNGRSRIISLWDIHRKGAMPSSTIPTSGHDGQTSLDHGTHVAGIAAGSRHGEDMPYYGMAPEADLVLISSNLTDDEVMAGARHIKYTADAAGKPWVMNMSFGTYIGSHDGLQPLDIALETLQGPGAIMAGAVGNENGLKYHAMAEFANGDTLRTLTTDPKYSQVYCDVWGLANDSSENFFVNPCVYNTMTKKKIYLDNSVWQQVAFLDFEINPYNRKEHYQMYVDMTSLSALLGANPGVLALCMEFRPLHPEAVGGHGFHAWTADEMGEFGKYLPTDAPGDSHYMICDGGSCGNGVISVGAYNGADNFVAAFDKKTYAFNGLPKDNIATYSSHGPALGTDPKPAITAPGSTIASAINRYTNGFAKSDPAIVMAVDNTGKPRNYSLATAKTAHFYGVKCGTSMATPAVTGIIALWLQANPRLTSAQIKEIIRKTAIRDEYTGANEWNATRGYGKINAYEGLREALRLAETDGINDCLNTSKPVTLDMRAEGWRVLFNNDESFADISLLGIDGRTLQRTHLLAPRRGCEHTISFDGIPAGIYLLRIATTGSVMTRRVIVK